MRSAIATTPGGPPPHRALPRRVFFEFQVTEPATYRGGGSAPPADDSPSRPLVQFIVDSAGAVDTATVKVLASRGRELARAGVIATVREWRYRPARVASCPVAQLLQVPLP